MNKFVRWFFILLVAVAFIIIFANAFTVSQKTGRAKEQLFEAAKAAVVSYLHIPSTSQIIFASNPILYSENGCVVSCYVDLRNTSGAKRRTWLDVLIQRDDPGQKWTGTIIKYTPNQPIVSKNLKPAPWDLFKSKKR
jgi:hypothetical protein